MDFEQKYQKDPGMNRVKNRLPVSDIDVANDRNQYSIRKKRKKSHEEKERQWR